METSALAQKLFFNTKMIAEIRWVNFLKQMNVIVAHLVESTTSSNKYLFLTKKPLHVKVELDAFIATNYYEARMAYQFLLTQSLHIYSLTFL